MRLGAAITSRTNAKVKALRAAFDGRASQPGALVAIEGEHLIAEAVRSELKLQTIFVREGSEHLLEREALKNIAAADWAVLGRDAFESAVDTHAPQGIAALAVIPAVRFLEPHANPGMLLFLEDIQDPGNLGTLLRTAEAFGVRAVYCTPATVNAWNPKVVRSSAGSVFRMPVFRNTLAEFDEVMRHGGVRKVATVVRAGGAVPASEADLHAPCVVMIGNEGAGLSSAALAIAELRVNIPCSVESLNAAVAGAVLMYAMAEQNRERFAAGAL